MRLVRGNVSVYTDRVSGVSGWSVDLGSCRFFIALSPGMYRGFSGEEQVLESLADSSWQNVLDQVKAQLNGQAGIDPKVLSDQLNVPANEIQMVLDALANRGLVGYDLSSASYCHRELPFSSVSVDTLQPRLVAVL
ncbi:MAG: hypothetical protein P8J37_12535 [Fuerstiella sp.]|nr:hypothetical protein [Fuerstiella sp.]